MQRSYNSTCRMTGNPRYLRAEMKKRIAYIMTQRLGYKLSLGSKLLLASAGLAVVGGPLLLGLVDTMQVRAQSSAPDWEEAAGGRMTFDSASITQSNARVPLGVLGTVGVLGSQTGIDWK
jgi:hypothetical protein